MMKSGLKSAKKRAKAQRRAEAQAAAQPLEPAEPNNRSAAGGREDDFHSTAGQYVNTHDGTHPASMHKTGEKACCDGVMFLGLTARDPMQPNGKLPSSEEERRQFVATFQWKMSKGGKDGMADLDFHPATNAVLGLQGFFGLVIDDVWKEHGLFHLLPTHLLAEMCDEYASDTSFVFSVSKAHVSGGEWDLGKAAEAAQTRDWDNLLRYTATSLPDFVDHVVEAHEQRKAVCPHGILTLWEEANVPYCMAAASSAAQASAATNDAGLSSRPQVKDKWEKINTAEHESMKKFAEYLVPYEGCVCYNPVGFDGTDIIVTFRDGRQLRVQLKEITPSNNSRSANSEYNLDIRIYRKRRVPQPNGSVKIEHVVYSFFDCDMVVIVIMKPPSIPAAEEPTTFLFIPKELLVAGGCMASEAASSTFRTGTLEDHPLYDAAEKTIPVGTKAVLAGPVPMCSDLHPMSLGHTPDCHEPVVNVAWKLEVLDCAVDLACPFTLQHPQLLVKALYARGGKGFAVGALPRVIKARQMRPFLAQRHHVGNPAAREASRRHMQAVYGTAKALRVVKRRRRAAQRSAKRNRLLAAAIIRHRDALRLERQQQADLAASLLGTSTEEGLRDAC